MINQKIREFEAWLAEAARGDEYVYHTGDVIPESESEIQQRTYLAYEDGEVELYQRRISGGGTARGCRPGVLAYVARRRGAKLPMHANCPPGRE